MISILKMEIEQQSSKEKKRGSRMKRNENKWIDSTKFNCTICDTNISGRKNVKHHFQNFHEGSNPFPEGMRKSLHTSVKVVEGEFYFCKIEGCQRSLKTFYDNINQHLANVHKMTMVQYHDRYEKKQIFPQTIVKRSPTKVDKEDKIDSDLGDHKNTSNIKPNITLKSRSYLKNDIWSGVKWYNRCKFMCQLCNEVFNGYEIRSHMASCHKQSEKKEYFPITTDKYNCKICDKTIGFLQIKSHVYSKHRLVFSEYGRRFENRNLNRKGKKLNSNERQDTVANSSVKVKAESTIVKIEEPNSSKRKFHDLNNPKVKRQKSVLQCNICYLICYSVPVMKNHKH